MFLSCLHFSFGELPINIFFIFFYWSGHIFILIEELII